MEIKLKYGIDNLLFGMKEQDVTKILGKPDSSYKDEDENVVFVYNSRKLRLTFYKEEDYKFEIGKATKIKEGTDVAIISNGTILADALKAAEKLETDGISCTVIDMHTVKPLDTKALEDVSEHRLIVTVEEHSTIGGLGDAVLSVLANNPVPTLKIGVNDVFGESGPATELVKKYGLDAESIYNKVKAFC